MASSPRLPTPSRNGSIQPDHSLSSETAGMSDLRSFGQPKNYFQPINDQNLHNSQQDHVTAASSSTVTTQNEAFTEPLVSSFEADHVLVHVVTPHLISQQTTSPVPSCLERASLPVTQSLSFITSSTSSSGNSFLKPPDLGTISSSPTPTSSAPLTIRVAPKTPSPQLLLPTLEAVSSEASQIQFDHSTEHASSGLCSALLSEDVVVTSWVSHHLGNDLKLVCGSSSQAADQTSNIECIQRDEDENELGNVSKENKMNCISDEGLTVGAHFLEPYTDISDMHLTLSVGISPKVPADMMSEENVKSLVSLKNITPLSVFTCDEESLKMPSIPEEPTPVSDIRINQVEYNQSDPSYLRSHVLTNTPEAKSGELVDYMSVSYLQGTKAVQEEAQRTSNHKRSNQQVVSSTLLPNVDEISSVAPLELVEDLKNDDLQHQHGERGHKHSTKGQRNTSVVSDSIPGRKQKFVFKAPRNIDQPVSHNPVELGLEKLPTHWMPQSGSEANYTNYYRYVYPGNETIGPPFSDQHSVYYPWAQNAWMDSKGYCPQTGYEAQFYCQNHQKKNHQLKQLEHPSSEHSRNLNELTSESKTSAPLNRKKKSKDRSARADQNKISLYYAKNSEVWDSQGCYSPAYYQGYYYPSDYGYRSEVSKIHKYYTKPDTYDDWWRYDPRYDSTFGHDHFARYGQSYGNQCERQSCHSGYSTQSTPSTHSNDSHFSWYPEQSWGYQCLQNTDYSAYGKSAQLHPDGRDPLENEPRNQYFSAACSSKSETSSEEQGAATLEKFTSPHSRARFGPSGQLIQVLPNLPSEGKPALVLIHSTEMMLQGLCDQLDLKTFPGPLTKDKTDKAEVLGFIKNKCQKCLQNDTRADEEVSYIIWELMRLICRQNGKLVGTDVSHLLLRNQSSHCSFKKATSDLIDFTHEPIVRALENHVGNGESTAEDTERDMQHFRELLIFGKKKDALKSALSKGLWGHAFMLARKMDTMTYSEVMNKFVDSLPESDALWTFYQLMSGRIPVSASDCRFKEQKDWRIHLAMVLSNHTCFKHLHKKTLTKMGDTLASKGNSEAASFCYMVGQLDVDTQSDKSDIFLFGASTNVPLVKFATNKAIQQTEILEYSLSLGTNSFCLPNFQVFKFIYACRLAEAGLCTQAFQYCEVITKALLATGAGNALTLISQLLELSAKIRHFDQQLKDIPEPEWMINLKILRSQIIEQLNSTSFEQQDADLLSKKKTEIMDIPPDNTDIAECDSSYEVAALTTEMPEREENPAHVQLVLPASQDITAIRPKAVPLESRHVLDSGPPEPTSKVLPLHSCPVSQKRSLPANGNSLPERNPTVAMEPEAVYEPQLLTVPPSVALLPERLVHTEAAGSLSEDQSDLTTETSSTLLLCLPTPPTLPQIHPVMADSNTVRPQCTENLWYTPSNTHSMCAEFTMPTSAFSSATLPSPLSLVTEPELMPQITVPLPYAPVFAQTGQPYQRQHSIPQLSGPVDPPPLSSSGINLDTDQYSHETQPTLHSSPPLLYEPLVWRPLHPPVSNASSQSVYTMESQTAPLPTMPLSVSIISPPSISSACSAKQSQHGAQTEFVPPTASHLPAQHMLGLKASPQFGKKPCVTAEKSDHPGQMHAAPKPFMPKLFVPQSPVPDPQPQKEAGGGWFSWLFRKKSEVCLVTGPDKSDDPNAK